MASVSDVMTRGVRTLRPDDSVIKAAQSMDEMNVGVIPVVEGDRLVGVVTDRDIVVRGVAQEADMKSCKLSDVMSGHVRTVREDDDVDDVLGEMASAQIRRMPVVDAQDRLVGIISLGDIAAKGGDDDSDIGMSLGDISEPAQPNRSGQPKASGLQGAGKPRTSD